MSSKKNLLERLDEGIVVGDGSFLWTLEKRGYVAAGAWTPEATVLYPDAVRQLHREFLRAGADVMQTLTFYGSNDALQVPGRGSDGSTKDIVKAEVNSAACDLAREIANEGDALVAGSLSSVPGYREGKGKEFVQEEFRKQCEIFIEKDVDFILAEWFGHVEEAEWAIEVMQELKKPIACTLRIPAHGDLDGVSPGECAVRMVKAGADVVGINCCFDPTMCLETMGLMKSGLESAGLKAHLIAQPVGFHTEDLNKVTDHKTLEDGYAALPDYPFSMETRTLSRIDVQKFARKAYELGVRYIGGCCGFEPYHIRAIAEELSKERGKRPPGADMSRGYGYLKQNSFKPMRNRADEQYWMDLIPAAGREVVKKLADVDLPK